jgi:enamine deaminase RidA (YjgF/YER057c/UK114 family)
MEPIELVRSRSLYPGAPYAYAAIAPEGARLVFLAGACPIDADGTTEAAGSYAGQVRAAFRNMVTALGDSGCSVTDVLSTRLLVATADRQDLDDAWDAFRELMGAHDAPSTLMGVTVLGYPGQLVEIEAVAARRV